MDARYEQFDPFIIVNNLRQVYYVSYRATTMDKRGWCEGRVALERECYESTQGEAIQHRAIQHRRRNSSRQGGDNH